MTSAGQRFIVTLVSVLLCAAVLAQPQSSDSALDEALHLLEEGRTTLADQPLSSAHDALLQLCQQHPDNAGYFYELGRVNRYRVEGYVARNDKKNAERALDEAIGNLQQSLKLNEKSADAHSLLADLYGRKIGLGMAMFAGPRYGPKVEAENRRAFELDSNNAHAFASRGRQYLEAPKMFGGDLDKAIADFRKSTELDSKSDETFVWLAIALRKKGDNAGADRALQEALRLNPRGAFARHTAGK